MLIDDVDVPRPDPLYSVINDLFEKHSASAVLRALGQRVQEESALAGSETRQRAAHLWAELAEDILSLAEAAADDECHLREISLES